jgi:hypothetical protein
MNSLSFSASALRARQCGCYCSRPKQMARITFGRYLFAGWRSGFLFGVLIAASFAAYGDEDDTLFSANVDRRPIEELFKTDTVYPQMQGEVELEVGSLYQNYSGGHAFSIPVGVEYGLTYSWQVEAEWDSYVWHHSKRGTVSGIGNLELGTKYSFLNVGGSLFHIAPRFSVEIPTGDINKGLSEGFMEYQPAVVLARDFPELHRTQVFTEIGLNFVQRVKTPNDVDDPSDIEPAAHELNVGAGFFTLFAHGALTMEFNWSNNQWNHDGKENLLYATPGVLWRISREMELGVGVPIGLNKQSDRYQVAAHFVIEF